MRNFRNNRSRYGSSNRRGGSRQKSSFGDNHSLFIKKANPVTIQEYNPKHLFADFGIEHGILNMIYKNGFKQPSPIQDQAIPEILAGRDLIGLANTGTGKTAAFLIPLLHKAIEKIKKKENFSCLIVAPTRELAIQIDDELKKLTTHQMRIFSTSCVGGSPMGRQISRLKKFPNHFVIGTPGRLVDLVDKGVLKLGNANHVVLDEVDRMLEMGFIEDINYLVDSLNENRQSLFFSATLDKKLEPVTQTFLKDPVKIVIKSNSSSENVDQNIIKIFGTDTKIKALKELLDSEEFKKVLVFASTKIHTDKLQKMLKADGYDAECIHGDKTLGERRRALEKFKNDDCKILVATDVAARGLDVNNISHVINYDLPNNYDDYIHRIGRTGRGGKTGIALTFVNG
jgi:superfamily II DNA/RNA helicase